MTKIFRANPKLFLKVRKWGENENFFSELFSRRHCGYVKSSSTNLRKVFRSIAENYRSMTQSDRKFHKFFKISFLHREVALELLNVALATLQKICANVPKGFRSEKKFKKYLEKSPLGHVEHNFLIFAKKFSNNVQNNFAQVPKEIQTWSFFSNF